MLDINLKQLEAFVATAEYRSFTKAAEAMYVTQSTISAHISALEQILGFRLIQRGARQRVALTEEGQRVYQEAKNILYQCQSLQNLGGHGQENGLALGVSAVSGQWLVPDLMAGFLERYPGSHYVQQQCDSVQAHRLMEQGKVRLGFVDTMESRQNHNYSLVAEDRLVVVTSAQRPYQELKDRGVSGDELLGYPMILGDETSDVHQAMDAYLFRLGAGRDSLNVVAQIDQWDAVRSGVSRGLGVAVMSWLTVRGDVEAGKLLVFELGEGSVFRQIYLTWRKDAMLSEVEQRFIRFVQEHSERVHKEE